ncbi:hypothetical protein M0654_03725 [Rhizobium sp. NTR19]|uniref:Uncharacterized protein n=1 Tax=Neorhizobium turbinariae TaxID=2937795 RepID=A0ABT0IMJ9_9HYPH|nr:hypothetical protein [Neorhizobium turbinariae]MCK8779089.1 hypothetical protein [Neorhizobium turbinariae]
MEGWLKTLIATACAVVIAGGGYYAWSEYKAADRRKLVAQRLACTDRLRGMEKGVIPSDNQQFLTRCMFNGFISQADLDRTSKRILGN